MRFVVIGCLCGGVLATVGCADGRGVPSTPSAIVDGRAVDPALSASPRSGDLRVTKECSQFATASFCTILTSNVKAIEVGTRIRYFQPEKIGTPSGSDVVLDPPGPGNNKAFGNCSLAVGVCTFAGGTGKFASFRASVDVTHTDDFSVWFWDGTYSFSPLD